MIFEDLAEAKVWAFGARRERGVKIALTNGCYDIFHAGHASLLSKIGEKYPNHELIVAVNGDSGVRRLKGADKPVIPEGERAYVVACHKAVAGVLIFNEDTPIGVIDAIRPDVLIKGGDWSIDNIVGAPEVLSWGGAVETVPLLRGKTEALSSSTIIQRIVRAFIREQGYS